MLGTMMVEYWHWWVLATILLILEVFAPGAFMLWMGIAAAVIGALLLIAPDLTLEVQLLAFSILSVASIVGWRLYVRRNPPEQTDEPTLNRRGSQYIGRVFTLDEPIVNGVGKLRVDDTTWKVAGPDLPLGARVRVGRVDNTVLLVEAADAA
jgi:membrane protein implicated in regulation of membrane protease activity